MYITERMKREAVIVGLFGLGLGLLVAWGIWSFRGRATPQSTDTNIITETPSAGTTLTPKPTAPAAALTLSLPENQSATDQQMATVSGKTASGSQIVISSSVEDKVATADAQGNFQSQINLEEGENEIIVTAYLPNGKTEQVTRMVIYSKDAL